jgi:hypothetical protein
MLSTYLQSSRAVFLATNLQDKSIILRDCVAFRNELQPEEAVLCLWVSIYNGYITKHPNLSKYRGHNLCIFIVMSVYSYCMFIYLHLASWHLRLP